MNRAATIALTLLGLLYGAAMRARAALYEWGILRTHKIDSPVISVGNLTTGGTGKTPLVEAIAEYLAAKGNRVCILTRGYGRDNSGQRVVVSRGTQILDDVTQTGDEPLMLAEKLKGKAAVICDADRVSAARWAEENLASDIFILDDGFQNQRIARNLNIVTIDGTNPWGNKKVLPAGTLRESRKALRRADCVVLTRTEQSTDSTLPAEIEKISDAPVFRSRMVTLGIHDDNSARAVQLEDVARHPIAAFCAVGNPEGFFNHLRESFELADTTAFRDHHQYSQADIDWITKHALGNGAEALVTTAKDAVKLRALRFDMPCYIIDIKIEFESEERFFDLIDQAVLRNDKH